MEKRRFGETQCEKRLEKEEIEAKTGVKQGLFESYINNERKWNI